MRFIRFYALFLLCFLLLALPVGAAGQGDTNGDGTVGIQDATVLLQYISSGVPVPDEDAFDVNGDGFVTIKDVTGILQIINGSAVRREPRLTVTPNDSGLLIEAAHLPAGIQRASVLVLGDDVEAATWKENLGDVKGIGQLAVSSSSGNTLVPVEDPAAACIVVVTYNGGQLVREVN